MGNQSVQRSLAAIVAADVAGYTRLMEQDNDGTVAAWQAARDNVVKSLIHRRRDAVPPFDEGRRLAATIPKAQRVELDTTNHIPIHYEPVSPRIVGVIHNFLAQHAA